MTRSNTSVSATRLLTAVVVILVVAVLAVAKEVLLPLAMAILLSFVLTPIVALLERRRVPRAAAVTLVILLLLCIVLGFFGIVGGQVVDLARNLPAYKQNIQNKVAGLTEAENGLIGRIRKGFDTFTKELSNPRGANATPATATAEEPAAKPLPVAIVETAYSPFSIVTTMLAPVPGALASIGVVLLFVFFMLLEREELRNRVIRLIGPGQIQLSTRMLDDAADRVSRFLMMQLIINTTYGVILAVGLYFIGIPNAMLWGLLAGLLRYIPYIGPWIAAAFPLALSLAVFNSWGPPLATLALIVLIEMLSNNIMEPILYRTSTGVSTLGILVSTVFWTWLWGAIGLVLATPLTVCIAVLARHVPQLEFLDVLLSDDAVLPPGAHYYQRLLAGDQDEANEVVEKFLETHPAESMYDEVLLPALAYAEQDRHRGGLDKPTLDYIQDNMGELLEEIGDRQDAERSAKEELPAGAEGAEAAAATRLRGEIAILPARDEADELAATMLAQLLEGKGYGAKVMSAKSLAGEMLDEIAALQCTAVFVSAVPPLALRHSRYLCKRLRARFPDLKIIVGLWHHGGHSRKAEQRLNATYANKVVTSLQQALGQL